MKIVFEDILNSNEEYILHQTNCVTTTAGGLAKTLFQRFPYANTYSIRRRKQGSFDSIEEDRSTPGTIDICGNGKDKRYIINMNAQYFPGEPIYEYDSASERFKWFKICLKKVATLNPKSVAIPWMIGCGLAGGNWNDYFSAILSWSKENLSINVVLYKKD